MALIYLLLLFFWYLNDMRHFLIENYLAIGVNIYFNMKNAFRYLCYQVVESEY